CQAVDKLLSRRTGKTKRYDLCFHAPINMIGLRAHVKRAVKRQQPVPRLLHRARTALRAASDRSVGVNLAARAAPPFLPPRLPRSTAAASLPSSTRSTTCPVA